MGITMQGVEVDLARPEDVHAVDRYDAVVLGSAVNAGHWLPEAAAFVERYEDRLADRPVWLFSSGSVGNSGGALARKMAAEQPLEVGQIRDRVDVRDHRVFAGRLDRRRLGLVRRAGLVLFPSMEGDFRDWDQIHWWGSAIGAAVSDLAGRDTPDGPLASVRKDGSIG
jgi:menaquinone-dependent protoporphyrinogen oxidase